jgi:hypothetical protein
MKVLKHKGVAGVCRGWGECVAGWGRRMGSKMIFEIKRIMFSKKFKLLSQIKGNSINVTF